MSLSDYKYPSLVETCKSEIFIMSLSIKSFKKEDVVKRLKSKYDIELPSYIVDECLKFNVERKYIKKKKDEWISIF